MGCFFLGAVVGDFLEEDGDALHGLVAERALISGKLEGVSNFVGEDGGILIGLLVGLGLDFVFLSEAVTESVGPLLFLSAA